MNMRRAAAAGAWAILVWSRGVRAEVDLAWDPPAQCAAVGSVVHVGLLAASDTGADQSLAGMDVVLRWDPAVWELRGVVDNGPYHWLISGFQPDSQLDGLNDSLLDGDAIYSALAGFGNPALATPDGLLVTTFAFTALEPAELTQIVIEAAQGKHSLTQVFGADYPNQDVTGALGECAIRVVPLGDSDGDGDSDAMDFLRLQTCFVDSVGPIEPPAYPLGVALCCSAFDFDGDGDVDLMDYEAFQTGWDGPLP